MCLDNGRILASELARWYEHLAKKKQGTNHEEYGIFYEYADRAAPEERLRYASELDCRGYKWLSVIYSDAWCP